MRTRRLGALAVLPLLASLLAACGGDEGAGTRSVNWYNFPDDSGALQKAADRCSRASGGRYRVVYHKLPRAADGQRQQLVRRLAAKDDSLDILGLDVTWPAEFAEARWIREWTGAAKRQATEGTLRAPLQTSTWKGKLYAVPYNTNTQLLWYRKDLVPTAPTTWAELLDMARRLARQGKPHYVEIQGAQYEGLTVWFNTLVNSAGGAILNPSATEPSLGPPAMRAAGIMRDLANSPAADPSLSNQMEDQNRLAMESGTAAFELNYPFVHPSMKANNPRLFKNFRWAPYPRVDADRPARPTIGGIDLAVSAYSRHPDLAFEAALCLRNRENQLTAALEGGLPPTLRALYDEPSFVKEYPFAGEVLAALQSASVRPLTPAYQNVSIVISHALSPPSAIEPESSVDTIREQIDDALRSKGVIP
ncbi:ABC transporter substrate-binding protein [Streptomyces ipomoeae]|uniref:ABC transporter, substrate-binding protein n=1 Tax=Streptomyces ipomoeae 91-03 TaxID=698759 RepID=L1KMJ0_9ACTN|nr:ABC transporter substrate-binding protein [Streptomyces ipomoeae]EKX61613.1 ABC transporter, substrate-binding protein [Streptomyces ipomoeae 91-03]MDX2693344.1 ABC transporter substrate-binding protein [Streptomyces ipomoeae]MDX2820892.1 ABC transporter substrate-binding protein [Streptomyces ipomoeae]MDX2838957.1 ABC transporter substrate-binding protein [Streptomyces ipomoeae]MDX2873388.1 ABC transporter substrate-binding protein [Streptomyces ipomoeae]